MLKFTCSTISAEKTDGVERYYRRLWKDREGLVSIMQRESVSAPIDNLQGFAIFLALPIYNWSTLTVIYIIKICYLATGTRVVWVNTYAAISGFPWCTVKKSISNVYPLLPMADNWIEVERHPTTPGYFPTSHVGSCQSSSIFDILEYHI